MSQPRIADLLVSVMFHVYYKLLKEGYLASVTEVSKGDTRSLDHASARLEPELRRAAALPHLTMGLFSEIWAPFVDNITAPIFRGTKMEPVLGNYPLQHARLEWRGSAWACQPRFDPTCAQEWKKIRRSEDGRRPQIPFRYPPASAWNLNLFA